MGKRNRDSGQFAFDFGRQSVEVAPASFAGLEAQLCRAAGDILHGDQRRREVIAAEMSVLLEEDISRAMLDAMASPARDGHRVHMSRFLILALVCGRRDIVDRVLRPLGMAVLDEEGVLLTELGHLRAQQKAINERVRRIEAMAKPMERGKR